MITKEGLSEEYNKVLEFCGKYRLGDYEEKLKGKLSELKAPIRLMIAGERQSGKTSLFKALTGKPGTEDGPEPDNKWSRPWPEEDVYISDTPAFERYLNSISGAESSAGFGGGIRFAAGESLDDIYYKADLVLWCFRTDSVSDMEVGKCLEYLSSRGKRIFGIISKTDLEEAGADRERVLRDIGDRFRKYNLCALIPGYLPPMLDGDGEDEKNEKQRKREFTTGEIKDAVCNYIAENGEEAIKLSNSEKYLQKAREDIVRIMPGLFGFLCSNYDLFHNAWDDFSKDDSPFLQKAIKELEENGFADMDRYSDTAFFSSLWDKSGANARRYAELIAGDFSGCGLVRSGKRIFQNFLYDVEDDLKRISGNISWTRVTFYLHGRGRGAEEAEYELEESGSGNSNNGVNLVMALEQAADSYRSMFRFDREEFTRLLTRAFSGGMSPERAASAGMTGVIQSLKGLLAQESSAMADCFNEAKKTYHISLEEGFELVTGITEEDLPVKLMGLEQKLLRIVDYRSDGLVYYPQNRDGKLYFFASAYSRKFQMEPVCTQEELRRLFGELIDYVIALHKKTTNDIMRSALRNYRGKEEVSRPEISSYTKMEQDAELLSHLPELNKIEWSGERDNIENLYAGKQKKYSDECLREWENLSEKAEKHVLLGKADEMEEFFRDEFEYFCDVWRKQAEADIGWYIRSNCLTSQPPNMDYSVYYFQVYQAQHWNDNLIKHIIGYKKQGRLPADWEFKWQVISTKGKPMQTQVKAVIASFLDKKDRQLSKIRETLGKDFWDPGIREIEAYGCRICDEYFYSLEQYLKTNIIPSWAAYKSSGSGNRISNILDYAAKSGKLPENFRDFITGTIPELKIYGNVLSGDGRKMSLRWKDYIRNKLTEYLEKWK
ncbi:MAG: GTPase domain-containing protein [Lachnospiraceae bacterium]|nr:GTPase domain-containing protein [Lachnospiraceae bacterium]